MSIFSLVKGEKEHGVFEMRMFGGEVMNSYIFINIHSAPWNKIRRFVKLTCKWLVILF